MYRLTGDFHIDMMLNSPVGFVCRIHRLKTINPHESCVNCGIVPADYTNEIMITPYEDQYHLVSPEIVSVVFRTTSGQWVRSTYDIHSNIPGLLL